MWPRRHKPERRKAPPGVPDGPPVRTNMCSEDCYTGWDDPQHSEECRRRWREASLRVSADQERFNAEFQRMIEWRTKHRAGSGTTTPEASPDVRV